MTANASRPRQDRCLLLGCVKTKRRGRHPAKDLYVSPLFRKRRAYAEASGLRWFILSAEHGVVEPDAIVGYYDRTLNTMAASERRDWGERVVVDLRSRLGSLDGITFEVHAGARYVDVIRELLVAAGASIEQPTAGKPLGVQLSWYGRIHRVRET